MHDLYGADIGTTIAFRRHGHHGAVHPWPPETRVSAGRGVVFVRGTDRVYTTLFMEVYPPGAAFIRGEGATTQECEDAAWAKYQLAISCQHEWEPRGYLNGAGLCRICNTFGTRLFTGEQLGQYCRVCSEPTTHHWETRDSVTTFLCARHTPVPSWDRPGEHSDEPLDREALLDVLDGLSDVIEPGNEHPHQ